ncbi:MAG: hypothetical protein EXS36_10375 [Pedosphaera sp.]|nr:hypothetical protein [Pedosphaera sp.]
MSAPLLKTEVFAALPPPYAGDVKPRIRERLTARPEHTIVVLDDDPTGTQTVYEVPVLTTWDVPALRAEFSRPGACFYILTNSRSLVASHARTLNHEIATNLRAAAGKQPFTVVSRSDSTLRGHFPLETDVLAEELGPFDATLIIPYFEAGGRYTIHDVHYVAEGDKLIPAAEMPFAKDAVFGYQHSNLREWVEEKTQGRVKSHEVASVSLETIRVGGPQAVLEQLQNLAKGSVCIVNAAALSDMDVFALGLLMAEQNGCRYLLRSAAQIVAARLGLETRPLLSGDDLKTGGGTGGLVIVGSYVPKTTQQLTHLLANTNIDRIELPVPSLLDEARRAECIEKAMEGLHKGLQAKRDVVLYTSRALVTGDDAARNLQIGNSVSAALVTIVQRLTVRPRYLIAKGGITSSDLATRGLGVKRAMVAGQLLPGIPVWRLGSEAKFPELNYVVFPGNVGGPDALAEAVSKLNVRSASEEP